MKNNIIDDAKAYVQDLFDQKAGSHDTGHMMRVYHNAMDILQEEGDGDREIIGLAALLHDADDHKLFQTVNNDNARRFLENNGIDPEKTERIIEAINSVSFSQNRGKQPSTTEGKIVQDADRLDAIGAIGIARAFAYGGEKGRALEATLKHFDEKLLLLKDEMNTEPARRMAAERHEFMLLFLEEYKKEGFFD